MTARRMAPGALPARPFVRRSPVPVQPGGAAVRYWWSAHCASWTAFSSERPTEDPETRPLTPPERDSLYRPWFGVVLLVGAVVVMIWLATSLTALYDRVATVSPMLAAGVIVALLVMLLLAVVQGVSLLWRGRRQSRRAAPKVSDDPAEAARQSMAATRRELELISDEVARRALTDRLDELDVDLSVERYTIVVFGTTSAGKTSVIRALTGVDVGQTDARVGTTRHGQRHSLTLDGFGAGQLRVVDTPGLSEFGESGLMRETEARELAATADLLLFVVDQDLRDVEQQPLASLARLGKRCLVVLNKTDLYDADERREIVAALERRLWGTVDPLTVVCCAAAPAPVCVREPDGRTRYARQEPDVAELRGEVARLLTEHGRALLAQNVMLQAHRLSEDARDEINQHRRARAGLVIARFQWTSAGVLFVNPVPGLGALAATAINYQMIIEIARVFGVELSVTAAKRMAGELAQILVKMGVVGLASELLGKALKATVVGYVAGGAIEAVSGAYLTRLAGATFVDYFAHGQTWGDGGIQGAVERHFNLQGNHALVRAFVEEVRQRVFQTTGRPTGTPAGQSARDASGGGDE